MVLFRQPPDVPVTIGVTIYDLDGAICRATIDNDMLHVRARLFDDICNAGLDETYPIVNRRNDTDH
jgi:hypothetical protein